MTYSEKLQFVVANGPAVSFAYARLLLHLSAARMQMERIGAATNAARNSLPDSKPEASQEDMQTFIRDGQQRLRGILVEVHFYFVCWTGCRNMLKIIVGQPEFLEAKKIFDGHKKEFEHYTAGRNSFEHFHDHLPGQSEENRVKPVQSDSSGPRRIYMGLSSGKYIHSSLEWDITPNSLERLQKYVDEVLELIHRKADEELQHWQPRPDRIRSTDPELPFCIVT